MRESRTGDRSKFIFYTLTALLVDFMAVASPTREWFSRVVKASRKYLVNIELFINYASKDTPQEDAISMSVLATLISDCV